MNQFRLATGFLKTDLRRGVILLWGTDRRLAFSHFALQFTLAILPVLSLYFIKQIIELIISGDKSFREILPGIIYFSITQLLMALVGQWSAYVMTNFQQKLSDRLSENVLQKAIRVDYEYYENPVYHDTLHLAQFHSLHKMPILLAGLSAAFLNFVTLTGIILYFFTIQSSFALSFALLALPLAGIRWYYGFELYRLEKRFIPAEREANYLHRILTDVSFAKEVRVFGFGDLLINKFRKIRNTIHLEKNSLSWKLGWFSVIAEAAEILVVAIIFGILAYQAWQHLLTVGAFVIYIQGFQRLQSASKNVMQALVQLFQLRLFLSDLFSFLDLEGKQSSTGNKKFPLSPDGLNVQNLSFTYPGAALPVLLNNSISCRPGEIIAIVGENGSGKSTLVKLLANLYPLQSGSIRISGIDLKDISPSELSKNSVFLFQDFEKYYFSVMQNIALGDSEPTETRVKKAATQAGADAFISRLPNGYDTRMGMIFDGSTQLSGGEWQKLVLARIFYRNARLIVLDEPTSALDAFSEKKLFMNIKANLNKKMIILVSHRLYNLKIADRIYMMKDGKIAQQGSFDELISYDGEFKKMYEAQKL